MRSQRVLDHVSGHLAWVKESLIIQIVVSNRGHWSLVVLSNRDLWSWSLVVVSGFNVRSVFGLYSIWFQRQVGLSDRGLYIVVFGRGLWSWSRVAASGRDLWFQCQVGISDLGS